MSEEVQQEGDFKIKSKPKMKNLGKKNETTKVDLSANKKVEEKVTKVNLKQEDANKEQETTTVVADKPAETVQEVDTEVPSGEDTVQDEGVVTIQEITEDDISEVVAEANITGKPLPENVEKLVSFMEETGGTVEDYVRLNADYSNADNDTLLKEYYKKSKPHLDDDEINFLLEDNFSYDEDLDEERDIRKKKLAFKEEVQEAKNFLEDLKGKYYDEIKLRPGVTQEQQKAMEFFNRYNEESRLNSQKHDRFKKATSDMFNNDFKGFDFEVGEKKFRYGVNNPTSLVDKQSELSNIIGKFLNDKGEVSDHKGYHKAMYAASNVDKIASHFYEQGKADAVKDVVNGSKNLSDEPRQTAGDSVYINGLKVKAISGVNSSKLKIKKTNFKN
ncbi:hypothetical protein N9459_02880 [Flavobacteriaceae bacterium]|nr:hypothetical protein [Flavobacteriaceae bacterium]